MRLSHAHPELFNIPNKIIGTRAQPKIHSNLDICTRGSQMQNSRVFPILIIISLIRWITKIQL